MKRSGTTSQRGGAPTGLQSVLDSIARTAARLCEARDSRITLVEGDRLRLVAFAGAAPVRPTAVYLRGLNRRTPSGHAVLDRRVIHIRDMRSARQYTDFAEVARASGMRTVLVAPLMRDGRALGAILIRRDRVKPFTAKQIALLEAFADQAAIAIENARLSEELAARNRELTAALEQQAASSEILKAISGAQTDASAVFESIARSAVRLCGAFACRVFRAEGEHLPVVGEAYGTAEARAAFQGTRTEALGSDSPSATAIRERRVVHYADVPNDPAVPERYRERARARGYRALMAVPMVRDGVALGSIAVARQEPVPFPEHHVELLKTFADQAVIAIENVRLFTELQDRNAALTQALDQQTATGEILRVISSSPTDLQPVFDAIVRSAVRLCEVDVGNVWRRDGEFLDLVASHNARPEAVTIARSLARRRGLARGLLAGRAILDRAVVNVADLSRDPEYDPDLARRSPGRSGLSVPLLKDGVAIGAITVARTAAEPFRSEQITLLQTFADQAVIAIENVRLFTELQERNRALSEALEQQTATAAVLRVISSSPTDVQPVFDAIVRNAVSLCEGVFGTVLRFDGASIHLAAHHNMTPAGLAAYREIYPRPVSRDTVAGGAILDRRVVQVVDCMEDPDVPSRSAAMARATGFRGIVTVPMLRDGEPIGVINVARRERGPFSDRQVALLQTFADQAVIAIENVRLFRELAERNADLTEALDQQRATGEILGVIARSPTDVQPVLDAVAESAARLCGATDALIMRADGNMMHRVAHVGGITSVSESRPITRDTPSGRAIIDRQPVHIPDAVEAVARGEFPEARALQALTGFRTILAVPLIRDADVFGVITIRRLEVRPFTPSEIALVKTFADQAVIAIENVRLFKELEERNRELTEALEQRTATAEILRVIAASPTELQPVLDTIARNAARVCGAVDATVGLVQGDVIRLAARFGPLPIPVGFELPLNRQSLPGRAVLDTQTIHVDDAMDVSESEFPVTRELARRYGHRSSVSTPLLRQGVAVGELYVRRIEVRPFTEREIELLRTFADQAVIAIENVRLFKELEQRNAALSEALEQQTATGEILRVISSSPTDTQPVFEAILESATRLCTAEHGILFRHDGEAFDTVACRGLSAEAEAAFREEPVRARPESGLGRMLAAKQSIQVTDVLDDDAYRRGDPLRMRTATLLGARTAMWLPLLKGDVVIGAMAIYRREVRRFTDKQIQLVATFADQAVIAIENVRLFKELEERNGALTAALEQQTATAQILRVISSSPTDLAPVFDAILANATRLCDAHLGILGLVIDGQYRQVADRGAPPAFREWVRTHAGGWRDPRTGVGRMLRDRRPIHIADLAAEPLYAEREPFRVATVELAGARTFLAVPMLKDGNVVGGIVIYRPEVRPFTDQQIALVQTFANQAVIAVENVRLFKELQARNTELGVALDQQTATAEILRAIAHAQTDVQPVFDAIVRSAARLCDAVIAAVFRTDGRLLYHPANYGADPEALARVRAEFPRPLDETSTPGRAILTRAVVHFPDVDDPAAPPILTRTARMLGFRSVVTVPMLREDEPVGALTVGRRDPGRFTDAEIDLLKTFADQAVIAIENVRLFNELGARNAALTESLEQQTATGEILRIISGSPRDAQPVFDAIAKNAVALCDAMFSTVFRYDGALIHHAADNYPTAEMRAILTAGYPAPADRDNATAIAIRERRIVHVEDILDDSTPRSSRDVALALGYRTLLCVPMIRDEVPIGTINVARREPKPFTQKQIGLIKTFADQAVIAVENVRLFNELEAQNTALTAALEQQTATAEILRVISQSPTDVQPVFDVIMNSAVKLCDGLFGNVLRLDGQQLHLAAHYNLGPEGLARYRETYPMPLSRDTVAGCAILDRKVIAVVDARDETTVPPRSVALARAVGFRAVIVVPMMLAGQPIGVINVARREAGYFSDRQIAILTTFADQAVIAIENVRLFTELQARTRELTRSVEQLTALGEVGQAVSSTLDLEAVLTTIAARASQLVGSKTCTVYEYDEAAEEFHLRATHNVEERVLALTRVRPVRKGEGVAGRVAETRAPVQVEDIATESGYHGPLRDVLLSAGVRAVLAIPLLRETRLIGSLIVTRDAPGLFGDDVIAVLQTFAAQSAIAIQNARLFRELAAKGRELAEASRHKSQFLANMSHELRTPMNAILGYTELIADGIYGEVPERMKDVLTRVEGSGRHLLGLINDVLDLSKIEAGQLTLTLADYAMKEIVEAVTAAAEPLAAAKNLRFVVDVAPGLPTGRGDQRRLAQVLLNLVGNAIKFTDSGHVALRIGAAADLFTIAVSDSGPGIAPADQERIFEEFQQADTSTTRPKGGTGLGLAIARRIVAMHGGRLWVESALGEGATFRLTLPVRTDKQVREVTA